MNCPVSGGAAHSSPTHSKTKAGALTGVRWAISELHLHLLWLARERFAAQRARHYRWAILGFLLTSMMASGQISPGSLSRSHQALDGITDCTTCHRLSTGKPTFRCIDCHSEIGSRVASHRGLHATYNIPPGSSAECVRCHSEHNGEDFLLIKWNPGTFDHKLTGYALEGKHAGVACNQCHTAEHISTEERSTIKVTHLSRTFLGLSRNCTTCHQDSHKGRLGSSCAQCHNYDNWQQISINQFDHSKTRYPLTGLHSQVGCQQCHTAGKDAKPRYTGFPFGRCADCHADPHRGRFEQGCESCHGTQGWNKIASDALSESFDHSKTKFPLLGKHIKVDCVECHSGEISRSQFSFRNALTATSLILMVGSLRSAWTKANAQPVTRSKASGPRRSELSNMPQPPIPCRANTPCCNVRNVTSGRAKPLSTRSNSKVAPIATRTVMRDSSHRLRTSTAVNHATRCNDSGRRRLL